MTLTRSEGILAFYGNLAFLPKSLIRNQIRFFPIFRLFLTVRLSDSTALIAMHCCALLTRNTASSPCNAQLSLLDLVPAFLYRRL